MAVDLRQEPAVLFEFVISPEHIKQPNSHWQVLLMQREF
jgi:hypothetical protein